MTNHITLPRSDWEQMIEALETAQNGLKWYRDAYPDADSQADDDMGAQIDAIIGQSRAARAGAAQAEPVAWPKLDKPAKVGGGQFGVGVSAELVVKSAQRLYEYEITAEKEAERIARGEAALAELRGTAPQPAQPVAVPHGWKLVPVEPTTEMCAAAVKFANGDAVYKTVAAGALNIEEGIYGEAYAAMLAAAPTPPEATVPVLEPLTEAEYKYLARGTCSVCKNGNTTSYTFTFLPHTLERFVREVEAALAAKLAKRGGW